MRRLRRRFNEANPLKQKRHDVERHVLKNISRDYKDVAEYIIDEVGIGAVIHGFIDDDLELIDVIYHEDALEICKQHGNVIMYAWAVTNGNDLPRRGTFNGLATALASNLLYVVTGEIYGIIEEEFDVEDLKAWA